MTSKSRDIDDQRLPDSFDSATYLLLNPDVEAAGVDPVSHYLRHGRAEGRQFKRSVATVSRPVYFCHIPKTAGTSLRASLESAFALHEILPDRFMMMRSGGSYPGASLIVESLREHGTAVRLVRGHYHISLRALLHDPLTITMLREPVARTVSDIKHILRSGRATPESMTLSLDAGRLPDGVADNTMTRYIGGSAAAADFVQQHTLLLEGPMADASARLASAKENLEQVDIVGVDGTASIEGALVALGFEPPRTANVAPNELELSDRHMQVIVDRNELDLQLYEFAKFLHARRGTETGTK